MNPVRPKFWIYAIFIGLLPLSPPCVHADGIEPLSVRSQSMSQFFRFDPIPIGTKVPEDGQVQVRMAHSIANQWGHEKRFIMDGQTQDDWLEIATGFGTNWSLGVGFGAKRVNPSYTDQITIGFHDLFFIPQGERLAIDQNLTRMTIPEYGLEITNMNHGMGWTEHAFVRLGRRLYQQGYFHVNGGLVLANEFSDNSLMGRGSQSYGSHLQLSTEWTRYAFLTAIHYVRHDAVSDQAFWLRDASLSWLMATEIEMHDWELLSQMLIQRGAARDLGQYSRNSYELHLGLRKQWRKLSFELTLIENVIWHFNSPDWGFALGLLYQGE
ncbi:MAG: DUF3187 family protein [Oligoflexus sp.]